VSARVVMPINTNGTAIAPGQSATITSDKSRRAWTAERMFVSGAGATRGAADWTIHSIRVNGHERLKASISGAEFSTAPDGWNEVRWNCRAGGRIRMIVEYTGRKKRGIPFYASLVGALR
jgi:hypothetical protein